MEMNLFPLKSRLIMQHENQSVLGNVQILTVLGTGLGNTTQQVVLTTPTSFASC